MKKILSVILSLCFVLGVATPFFASAEKTTTPVAEEGTEEIVEEEDYDIDRLIDDELVAFWEAVG